MATLFAVAIGFTRETVATGQRKARRFNSKLAGACKIDQLKSLAIFLQNNHHA